MIDRGAILSAFLIAVFISSGCSRYKECRDVEAAIRDLRSDDELVVRSGVRRLHDLAESRCIMAAVGPLAGVMNNADRRHDLYTRSLVPASLSRIARHRRKWKGAEHALGPLLDALFNERSDLLRARTAMALGGCGWAEVLRPLETASVTDDSELVRMAARNSISNLSSLPGGSSNSVSSQSPDGFDFLNIILNQEREAGSMLRSSAVQSSTDESQAEPCLTPEQYELVRKHMLLPDQYKVRACDQ